MRVKIKIWAVLGVVAGVVCGGCGGKVERVGAAVGAGRVEIWGVGAGALKVGDWEGGRLNFVADVRRPLMGPREGKFRNIYAPSVVALPDGRFRVFYGGWDGVGTGNDRIYSVVAGGDFLSFGERRTVVEHGAFEHVCNVSGVREGDGSFLLACTAYPDERGLNKVATFRLPAGVGGGPVVAGMGDLIAMEGYAGYAAGDLNGMNPIMPGEGGRGVEMYFGNFRDFGRVYRAASGDGKRFVAEGVALEFEGMPNDVKRLRTAGGGSVVVMALHRNGPTLYYALSGDGRRFGRVRVLGEHLGAEDRYIVSVGLVVRGDRVLGYLYGAGAVPTLDRNRIFARWLQRKVVFVTEDGRRVEVAGALGPDRAVMEITRATRGRVEVYGEDGVRREWRSGWVTLRPGEAYRVGD